MNLFDTTIIHTSKRTVAAEARTQPKLDAEVARAARRDGWAYATQKVEPGKRKVVARYFSFNLPKDPVCHRFGDEHMDLPVYDAILAEVRS